MENINGIMEEQEVENIDTRLEVFDKLCRKGLIDGRWLAGHQEDSIESKHFIQKEAHELYGILEGIGLEDLDSIDKADLIIVIEELLRFTSRIYSRCSPRAQSKIDECIEETESD